MKMEMNCCHSHACTHTHARTRIHTHNEINPKILKKNELNLLINTNDDYDGDNRVYGGGDEKKIENSKKAGKKIQIKGGKKYSSHLQLNKIFTIHTHRCCCCYPVSHNNNNDNNVMTNSL